LRTHKDKGSFGSKRAMLEHFDGKAETKLKKDMKGKGKDDDEDDELPEEILNKVYEKAVKNDAYLPYEEKKLVTPSIWSLTLKCPNSEMDPAPQFKLTLRPYQRQALKYASPT
jgi:hypothetical protein